MPVFKYSLVGNLRGRDSFRGFENSKAVVAELYSRSEMVVQPSGRLTMQDQQMEDKKDERTENAGLKMQD